MVGGSGNRSIMFAVEDNVVVRDIYIYRGRGVIPRHVTHVYVANLAAVPAHAFEDHPNIEEVECHEGVVKIEELAFNNCPRLRRVIMPGVIEIEWAAFNRCRALTYVEWGKLEIIGDSAFQMCTSLSSIDLPSIKVVDRYAFSGCTNLRDVKFGKELESVRLGAFAGCRSLERIILPLKDGMVTANDIFQYCPNLTHIDLIGGVHETVAALQLEEWKNDMNEEIDSISQILASAPAGNWRDDSGGKARAMRTGIESVLRKIIHYKVEHHSMMDEAAATIQLVLPQDIVRNNVLSFLELPSHTFDGEDDEEEDSDDDEEMDEEE